MTTLPDKDIGCHRTGFTKSCRECVVDHNCRLWQHLVGVDPQTGATFDNWGCADEFINKLLVENSQMSRQTGAAVESFRNAMVAQNNVLQVVHREAPIQIVDGTDDARN